MSTPNLLFWNRIEPHPRSQDLEHALQAPIRDPLWMLARQWQLGEFQGEDAGMATALRLDCRNSRPTHIQAANGDVSAYSAAGQPLEAVVERTAYTPDLFTRIEIGRKWLRLLERHLPPAQQPAIMAAFNKSDRLHFKLPEPDDPQQRLAQADTLSNDDYLELLQTVALHQKIDGGILIRLIADSSVVLSEYILGYKHDLVDETGQRLLDWARRIYQVALDDNPYWVSARLEHQFKVNVPLNEQENQVLEAREYAGKRIEWHQFDRSVAETAAAASEANIDVRRKIIYYPGEVRYPGMPASRWWELEDNAVHFGNVKAHSAGPANLIFTQFALLYSNDWLMAPLEVEAATLTRIDELVVIDNFGVQTLVRPVQETAAHADWDLFQLRDRAGAQKQQAAGGLWLPPAVDDLQTGKPLEQVHLIRDEMANLVWGIESIIPDQLGAGADGAAAALAVQRYLDQMEGVAGSGPAGNGARVSYRLAAAVPEHWIPFVPVGLPDGEELRPQIRLQRATLPRIVAGLLPERIRPRTGVLSEGLQSEPRRPMYLYEEEVPRSGLEVRTCWKRVRWYNGNTILWLAREKSTGRGEGSSGLRFDYLEDKV